MSKDKECKVCNSCEWFRPKLMRLAKEPSFEERCSLDVGYCDNRKSKWYCIVFTPWHRACKCYREFN